MFKALMHTVLIFATGGIWLLVLVVNWLRKTAH